jgi:hypothetical protein
MARSMNLLKAVASPGWMTDSMSKTLPPLTIAPQQFLRIASGCSAVYCHLLTP